MPFPTLVSIFLESQELAQEGESRFLSVFACLISLFRDHVYLLISWNDYKQTTRVCSLLVVLYKILFWFSGFFWNQRYLSHSSHVPFYHELHFNFFYGHRSNVEVEGTVWDFMSRLVALVASQGGCIPLLTSVNFCWYETSQSWVSLCSLLKTDYALCSHSDWNWCRLDWGRPWCSVSQFKCFISCTVLVNIFHGFVPSFQRGIRRTPIGHCDDGVLDLQIQSFPELYYGGFGIGVPQTLLWWFWDQCIPLLLLTPQIRPGNRQQIGTSGNNQ